MAEAPSLREPEGERASEGLSLHLRGFVLTWSLETLFLQSVAALFVGRWRLKIPFDSFVIEPLTSG